jgi:hypothetical protein
LSGGLDPRQPREVDLGRETGGRVTNFAGTHNRDRRAELRRCAGDLRAELLQGDRLQVTVAVDMHVERWGCFFGFARRAVGGEVERESLIRPRDLDVSAHGGVVLAEFQFFRRQIPVDGGDFGAGWHPALGWKLRAHPRGLAPPRDVAG